MSVYVDDMMMRAKVPGMRFPAVWCHLTATTTEELHAFAEKVGLRRQWFQPARPRPAHAKVRGRDHYDVTLAVRKRAVAAGAVEVGWGCEPWRDEP